MRLAEDLLVLARADDGQPAARHVPPLVREVLDAVAGRFDARAAALGRTIEVEAPADLALTGDRLRLEQALGNLVDNALRYGGGTVRIDAVADDGLVELRVSRRGRGLPGRLPAARLRALQSRRPGAHRRRRRARARHRRRGRPGARRRATATNPPAGGASISLRLPRLIPLSSDPPTVAERPNGGAT